MSKKTYKIPQAVAGVVLLATWGIIGICLMGFINPDPQYLGFRVRLEYLCFGGVSFIPATYILLHDAKIETLDSHEKKIASFIIGFIIIYYLFSPYQNCVRDFNPSDWRSGSTPITINLHNSLCNSETFW